MFNFIGKSQGSQSAIKISYITTSPSLVYEDSISKTEELIGGGRGSEMSPQGPAPQEQDRGQMEEKGQGRATIGGGRSGKQRNARPSEV